MTDPAGQSDPPRRGGGPFGGLMALFGRLRGRPAETPTAGDPDEPLGDSAEELISQARAFDDLSVDDVMKPRADIVAISKSCTFAEIVERFVEAEHSRMPVYKATLDEPVGVVHVKDVFKLLAQKPGRRPKPTDKVLQTRRHLLREVLYVPGAMPASDLLALMRSRRTHMALVIDEFGGTDGLVTLEDLLEKLVGEIEDEHDEEGDDGIAAIVEDAEGWVADGRVPLEELEEAMGNGTDLAPPDLDEEIDTVAGLVNALAGRVPQRRETIPHPGGFLIEVLSADPRRVKRVRVRRPAAQPSTVV